jgi:hypothetical protein
MSSTVTLQRGERVVVDPRILLSFWRPVLSPVIHFPRDTIVSYHTLLILYWRPYVTDSLTPYSLL